MTTGSTLDVSTLPENTHTVAMGVGDLNGIMRGKRVPATNWPTVSKNGNALSLALLVMDMTSDLWDSPCANMENGFPDMHMFPMTQPVASPWEPGVAICLGRAEGMDHKPLSVDPRNALVSQVERANAMGLNINIGAELEFYLLDPETLQPKDRGIQVYSLARAAELEHVVGPMRRYLNEIGIPIEQSNPEYAPGQVEINIRYGEALATADRVILFRSMIKEIAAQYGYVATFMAKPFAEESGNGFHTHHSAWKDGVNQFADNGQLSTVGKSYLAGLEKRMAECSLAVATTPNAYKRRSPYSFCPMNITWGIDNRTTALRIIQGADDAVRVEKRDGSADCNPYYLFATEIAAGLDGIEQQMTPSPVTETDAYTLEDAPALPLNIADAIELAKGSDFLENVLGKDRLTVLLQQAEREVGFLNASVSQVEIDRYLRNM